jgi:hypothetical protein
MSLILRFACVVLAMAALVTRAAADVRRTDEEKPRLKAAAELDKALSDAQSLTVSAQQIAVFRSAVEEAVKLVPASVDLDDLLKTVAQAAATDAADGSTLADIRDRLAQSRDLLRFEPLIEAPLPEGFPEPTPAGEIRTQKYPQYRLAKTDMTFFQSRAFWTLFNHIKKHEIAMTAPVEMQYATDPDGRPKESSMAFLYRSTQQGSPGVEDEVEVMDIPAHLAVSIGLRGDATKARVADAKRRLEQWIADHAAEYEASGALRVMGYNSPFVPDAKRFTEVQIPVRAKNAVTER